MRSIIQVRSIFKPGAAIVLLIFSALTFTAWAAQQPPPAQPAPKNQQQAVNPSDSKLEAVAKAYKKIHAVQQEYEPKIQAAQNDQQAQQLQDEARQQMVKAVNDSGEVTVDEYSQIMQAAQNDEQLRARLIQHIQKQP